jgi:DNA-binding IclR family transcriptional regulator
MDRAFQILDYLYKTNAPAGGYAIARAIDVPLSTTYLVLEELVGRDVLARRSDGTVWFGPRLYHYGLVYARSLDVLAEARRGMSDLCREVGETVQVCGRDKDHVVVLAMADGPGHYRVKSDVGTRVPVAVSASGPLLIGHLPEGERIAILNRSASGESPADSTISVKALSELSAHALECRLSIDVGRNDFRVATFASPISDGNGECVATLAIVLPEQKALANRDFYVRAVRVATEAVETRLGWRAR